MLYALCCSVFKQIRFMGLGVQVDVYAERMTDVQLGTFCLVGALATFVVGCLLTVFAPKICCAHSKLLCATAYYTTIAMLLLDPLYLSLLCSLFGGGDMNGISLLLPEWVARCIFGTLLVVNAKHGFYLVRQIGYKVCRVIAFVGQIYEKKHTCVILPTSTGQPFTLIIPMSEVWWKR